MSDAVLHLVDCVTFAQCPSARRLGCKVKMRIQGAASAAESGCIHRARVSQLKFMHTARAGGHQCLGLWATPELSRHHVGIYPQHENTWTQSRPGCGHAVRLPSGHLPSPRLVKTTSLSTSFIKRKHYLA